VDDVNRRLAVLERRQEALRHRMAEEQAARQLLRNDVRWIVRVAMAAAAVVSILISLSAQFASTLL
jgi:phage terminase Nu1 subunit (DNA packaging protein)